jgi:threonine aldolase
MRQAMFQAELGDDVYGEDPTINRLESMAAEMLGKEEALLVPSGTMANLACLLSHCGRGDEAIMGSSAHTFLFEAGGSAALGGIHPNLIPNQPDGTLDLVDIETAIRATGNPHLPITRLICLENSHNRCGGAVLSVEYMAGVRELADRYGLAIHLDGARLFNAAVALGVPVAELAKHADSVCFCLSKGLSAPVGSLICGSKAFIVQAGRQRKMLGGGMRQAGILAAAGIVALESMVERLAEDHANARRLAEGLSRLPGVEVDLDTVQTNIVIFALAPEAPTPAELAAELGKRNVKLSPIGGPRLRAVTHYGIETGDIDRALAVASEVLMA